MKRKALLLFAIASIMMLALPTKAWADGSNETQELTSVKTLPYPLATEPIPASAMEYDSIAECFVVRDTIVRVNPLTRSGEASTIETRAASSYTEKGVVYSYYGAQLSSNNMEEMKALLEPWKAEFKNLDIDGILSPADDKTWYMQITGVDNSTLSKNGGELRIYNDIGSSNDYKTIAIDSTALRGNEYIKRVVFEDCASSFSNASTMLKMVIHDGAFQNCKNLQELNMYYYVTKGTNHYEMLKPTDVYIGSNVFDGCHEDFRIVVDPLVYKMFIADANWSQYADYIVASDVLPETEEEDGVLYGYYGYQLSSNRIEDMAMFLEPWVAEFRNIDIENILSPAPGKETWYMQIVGVNNDEIDSNKGEMRIYNDIGTSYNYKTIAIDSTALRGNEHIKKVVFEDCASASENANTMLNMVIHNGAFKDCKNLKEFNMFYLVTEGTNSIQALTPTDIYIGSNVFDGCDEDFRIVVAPHLLFAFLNDPNWSQYADKIVASEYLPTVHDPITVMGVTYDYAANSLNALPTSELTRLQSSWWNAAIIGVEVAVAIATLGWANAASSSLIAPAQAAKAAAESVHATASSILMSNFKTMSKHGVELLIKAVDAAVLNLHNASGALLLAYEKAAIYPMMAAEITAASAGAINGLSYMSTTLANKAVREPTWLMNGQWLMTENKHTIYHMYVKEVENRETIYLYNDIGSAYNYKTVSIGKKAFHNKDCIKTIKFEDLYAGSEMYAPLNIVIPDSVFMGCTGLEELNLVMRSTAGQANLPLGPENLILCGEDLFPGCDMSKLKIVIGEEKYEEFAENPVWGKYKANFKVLKEESINPIFSSHGAQYDYTFEQNSLKKVSNVDGHTIEHVRITGQDTNSLNDFDGEVCLFNDVGQHHNYKLDYVKKKAFYGSQELKGISMFDLKGVAGFGDSYTEMQIVLQDSAFANCPNLEYINMLYFRTDGDNSVEAISPARVMLGRDVFKDSPKFKVKMVTTAVDEFKADTAWARYEEQFLPCFIDTDDEILKDIFEECGMLYYSPVWDEEFDIYDVTKVTDATKLNGKFKGKGFEAFREFKAFECIDLESVADEFFMNCKKLQTIDLPSTIKTIGKQAFYGCQQLDDVVIPTGVTSIGESAFGKCGELRSITFESSTPATLGNNVFADMPADYVIYVPEAAVETYKAAWAQYANHIQTVSSKHTGIFEVTLTEPGTLAEKLGLTITGTDPLTISGNYGKYDSLKVVGPINGTDIGVIRFMGGRDVNNAEVTRARNLKYLDLFDADIKAGGADYNQDGANDRITEDNCVDTYMFWQLDVLETLILPKSATKIKEYAFNHCNALRRLVIGDNVQSIGKKVTHDSPNLKEVIMLTDKAPATDANAWAKNTPIQILYTTNATRAHLSGSYVYYTRTDSIASAFEEDAVIHALADKRIFTIDDLCAQKSFENVVNGNTEIENFMELIYAVEVKELGDNSLSGCSSLKKVMLPYMVETISAGAFRGCSSLTALYAGCESIPELAADALEDLPENFVIYVQSGEEDAYRKAWPQYADHIQGFMQQRDEVKVVTVTEAGTLGEALGFTVNMDEPDNVGRIGGDFVNITALKVIGPINGKDIAVLRMLGGREEEDGDEVALARMGYLDLYDATICTDPVNICFNRDGVNDYVKENNVIPEHMFWRLDKLNTVILPKNVTKIADNAFYDNLGIENIVVGDATVAIGNDAFGKCKNLKNIVFLCNEKPVLDGDAFTDPVSDQPYQVEKMYVPASLLHQYTADEEYYRHTKEFCAKYEDDALFRAFGARAVMSNDQLPAITNIDGWFDFHNQVKDLTALKNSSVDTLKTATLAALEGLQKITLPTTLKVVEANVFAANSELQWADFSQCAAEGVLTESNINKLGTNEHALIYAPESFTATGLTNVVYGSEGNLKCDQLTISDEAAYAVPRAFKAGAISYDRQFVKNERTTLCLPFDMEVPAGVIAYELTGSSREAIVVSPIEGIMKANTPYVILTDENMTLSTEKETLVPTAPVRMSQTTTDQYVMTGTLTTIPAEQVQSQSMYLLGDDSKWYKESGEALLPYRAYLQATYPNAPSIVLMQEDMEESVHIVDGDYTEYEVKKDEIIRTLTYTRTLPNLEWNSLYVPFEIEVTDELLEDYDVAYANNLHAYDKDNDGAIDDLEMEIIKIKQGTLHANHPYFIRAKSDAAKEMKLVIENIMLYSTVENSMTCQSFYTQFTLTGIYSRMEAHDFKAIDGTHYAISTEGGWWGTEGLNPFRVYLTITEREGSPVKVDAAAFSRVRIRAVGEGNATDIEDAEFRYEDAEAIYDLMGRRVMAPQKGAIYIVNGKKVTF